MSLFLNHGQVITVANITDWIGLSWVCRIVLATIFIMAGNVFLVAFGNHQSLSKASLLHVLRTNKLAIARVVDAPQNCCILFLLLIGRVQINFDKRRIKRRFFFFLFFFGFLLRCSLYS